MTVKLKKVLENLSEVLATVRDFFGTGVRCKQAAVLLPSVENTRCQGSVCPAAPSHVDQCRTGLISTREIVLK